MRVCGFCLLGRKIAGATHTANTSKAATRVTSETKMCELLLILLYHFSLIMSMSRTKRRKVVQNGDPSTRRAPPRQCAADMKCIIICLPCQGKSNTCFSSRIEADVLERASSQTATDPSLVSASECRIADLFQKVNPKDGHFLKYLPDEMLTDLRKAAKKDALEEDRRRIASYKKSEESFLRKKRTARGRRAS